MFRILSKKLKLQAGVLIKIMATIIITNITIEIMMGLMVKTRINSTDSGCTLSLGI
jgi:hypothetical protein